MYQHRINPRRTAQGVVPVFSPTNTAVIGLFNDSTNHRLAVWGAGSTGSSTSGARGVYPLFGHLATLVGPGTVVWTNQGQISGVLYKDDLASPGSIAGGVFMQFGGGYFDPNVPLWILDPGWSLVLEANLAANAFEGTFMWEELSALAFPPHAGAYEDCDYDASN